MRIGPPIMLQSALYVPPCQMRPWASATLDPVQVKPHGKPTNDTLSLHLSPAPAPGTCTHTRTRTLTHDVPQEIRETLSSMVVQYKYSPRHKTVTAAWLLLLFSCSNTRAVHLRRRVDLPPAIHTLVPEMRPPINPTIYISPPLPERGHESHQTYMAAAHE